MIASLSNAMFGPVIGGAGSLMAAGAAITLAWRGRTKWEPCDEDLSNGSRKLAGLLSALAVAVLWCLARATVGVLTLLRLQRTAIYSGLLCFAFLLVYGLLVFVFTYLGKLVKSGSPQRIIGGLWVTAAAHDKIAAGQKRDSPPRNYQEFLELPGITADLLWPRLSRGLVKQAFVFSFIILTVSGTAALTGAALLVEGSMSLSSTNSNGQLGWNTAVERNRCRERLRMLIHSGNAFLQNPSPTLGQVEEWMKQTGDLVPEQPNLQAQNRVRNVITNIVATRIAALKGLQERLMRWGGAPDGPRATPINSLPRRCRAYPEDLLSDPIKHRDDIVIGAVFQNYNNEFLERAIECSVDEVNAQGGIRGHRVALISGLCNEQSSIDQLDANAATRDIVAFLANDVNVPVIIGADSSARTEVAYTTLIDTGAVIISPGATSDSLKDLDRFQRKNAKPGLLWRTICPDSWQGRVMAKLIRDEKPAVIAIAYEKGPYGSGLATSVQQALASNTIQITTCSYKGDFERELAFKDVLKQPLQSSLFMLISSSAEDYRGFFQKLRSDLTNDQRKDLRILVPDAASIAAIYKATSSEDSILPHLFGTCPSAPPSAALERFTRAYNNKCATKQPPSTEQDSPYTPQTYDAAWMTFYGILHSFRSYEDVFGLGIAEGWHHISCSECKFVRTGPQEWDIGSKELCCGRDIHLIGVSGPLDYNPNTEETECPIAIWSLVFTNGNWMISPQRYISSL